MTFLPQQGWKKCLHIIPTHLRQSRNDMRQWRLWAWCWNRQLGDLLGSCQERPGILFGLLLNMTGHVAQRVMHGELTRCYVYGLGKYRANSQWQMIRDWRYLVDPAGGTNRYCITAVDYLDEWKRGIVMQAWGRNFHLPHCRLWRYPWG